LHLDLFTKANLWCRLCCITCQRS